MSTSAAAGFASLLSFAVISTATIWYVVPWLRAQSLANALLPLLWVHVFRYVALQIFSAQRFGFLVSDGTRNAIAFGDVLGAALGLSAIVALRTGSRLATALIWVFVAESVLDLVNATVAGIREDLFSSASSLTWIILTFYVPVLWISLCLIVWQLLSRRDARLA
jgi:hypothetical protein